MGKRKTRGNQGGASHSHKAEQAAIVAHSEDTRKRAQVGFAGFSLVVALVIFAAQQGCTALGAPPNWIAGSLWFLITTLLILVAVFRWEKSAVLSWPKKLIGSVLVVGLMAVITLPPIVRQYVSGHMEELLESFVVALSDDPVITSSHDYPKHHYLSTGFFVNDAWDVATCAAAITKLDPTVVIPLNNRSQFVPAAAFFVDGKTLSVNSKIMFIRPYIPIPTNMNTDGHRVPTIKRDALPVSGEDVFMLGLEDSQLPSYTFHKGKITRIAVPKGLAELRIYSTLPFKNSYCGAPVVDSFGDVVAIAEAGFEGESQSIPANGIP